MTPEIQKLKEWIDESKRIVFFTGAGASTESGIPDFRSTDGLYNQQYAYPPEEILSHSFFRKKPEEFYRFYKDKLLIDGVKPNAGHLKMAELEKAGKSLGVVTQNIDGLHQAAGSTKVYELHGSVLRNYCMKCGKFFDESYMAKAEGVPHCDQCGEIIKPDVVLYEEGLDQEVVDGAVEAIACADMLVICGTSLVVYPAAGFVRYYNGHKLVLINKSRTQMDSEADLIIRDPIGEVLAQV